MTLFGGGNRPPYDERLAQQHMEQHNKGSTEHLPGFDHGQIVPILIIISVVLALSALVVILR
jgi:hypothetical protein